MQHFLSPLTSVHQQATLLCLLFVPLVIGEEDHLEPIWVGLSCLQMLTVPFGCHADCTVITVIGALPRFTFNECVSGRIKMMETNT